MALYGTLPNDPIGGDPGCTIHWSKNVCDRYGFAHVLLDANGC